MKLQESNDTGQFFSINGTVCFEARLLEKVVRKKTQKRNCFKKMQKSCLYQSKNLKWKPIMEECLGFSFKHPPLKQNQSMNQ